MRKVQSSIQFFRFFSPFFAFFSITLYAGDIWEALPHFHGSYSAASLNKMEHLYTVMENSSFHHVGSHIHFAGEAWDADFQGFMEGAVRSGEAAANYVLEHIQESESSSSSKLIFGALVLSFQFIL